MTLRCGPGADVPAVRLYNLAMKLLPHENRGRVLCGSAGALRTALWCMVLDLEPLLERAAAGAVFTGYIVTDGLNLHATVAFPGNDDKAPPPTAAPAPTFASPKSPHSTSAAVPEATPEGHHRHLVDLLREFTSCKGERRYLCESQRDEVVHLRRLLNALEPSNAIERPDYQLLVDDAVSTLEPFLAGGDPGGKTLGRRRGLAVVVRHELMCVCVRVCVRICYCRPRSLRTT